MLIKNPPFQHFARLPMPQATRPIGALCVLVFLFVCSIVSEEIPNDCTPSSQQPSPELKMSIIVARHGDRTPLSLPQNTKSHWPEGKGQLTGLGMRQLYELGLKFRERYVEQLQFLQPTYKPSEIHVRATQKDRTISSAQSFLVGLYPPGTGPLLKNEEGEDETALPHGLNIIPVHSMPGKLDSVLYAYKNCPRLKKMKKEFYSSPLYLSKEEQHSELLDELSEIFGEDVKLKDLTGISHLAKSERIHNRALTLNDTYWDEKGEEIMEISDFMLSHKYQNQFMGQLGVGFLPKEIQMRCKERIADIGTRLLYLSAHDGGILALLSFLKADYQELPGFSDYISFEMYDLGEENGEEDEEETEDGEAIPKGRYFIEILYKGLPLSTPACVGGVPGGNFRQGESVGVCDLTFFLKFLEGAILSDWPLECMMTEDNQEVVSYTYSANVSKILDFVEPLNLDLMEPGEEVAM